MTEEELRKEIDLLELQIKRAELKNKLEDLNRPRIRQETVPFSNPFQLSNPYIIGAGKLCKLHEIRTRLQPTQINLKKPLIA